VLFLRSCPGKLAP